MDLSHPPNPGRPTPGLLTIAPELRLRICKYVFSGSKIFFYPTDRADPKRAVVRGQHDAFTVSDHWHLLLTCRLLYLEARIEYCKSTQYTITEQNTLMFLSECVSKFSRDNLEVIEAIQGPGFGVSTSRPPLFPKLKRYYSRVFTKIPGAKDLPTQTSSMNAEELANYLISILKLEKTAANASAVKDVRIVMKVNIHDWGGVMDPSPKVYYPRYATCYIDLERRKAIVSESEDNDGFDKVLALE
ncbi:hypothetical protein LTR64_005250 [Lithohypha guttulata]|uniref:uncharacterized protein n=1 Tax=Lithohypha guttulata TaxID=1690604 RepID=UPI00315CB3DA